MHGLAHNLIHKKCAELVRIAGFIHRRTLVCPCLIFAQCKNSLTKQGHKNRRHRLAHNLIHRIWGELDKSFSRRWRFFAVARWKLTALFLSSYKKSFKINDACIGAKMLAHNLIHIFCAELPLALENGSSSCDFRPLEQRLFGCCLNFNQRHKNDINQCTWLLILRLHTILSTDCVQNLLLPSYPQCARMLPHFYAWKNFSFEINDLMVIAGFAHNLVHSKCAEL